MSLSDVGMSSLDLDGAPDLGPPFDFAAAVDLALPPDLLPACSLPTIAATVGPEPHLAITLSGVKIDGGPNVANVAAGATFKVSADYSITDKGAGNPIDQIILGFAPNDPRGCLTDSIVHNTVTGHSSLLVTAPTAPGLYTLRFHYGQARSCDLGWWGINGAPTAAQDFAAICVQ